jgi:cobalt-zinc-cadmium efflux system outer membrane protein
VKVSARLLAAALIISAASAGTVVSAAPLSVEQVVAAVLEVNPRVRAARARWQSATHTVSQTYAPADPILGFTSVDSPTNGFTDASAHTLAVSQPLQFPGKAILQHRNAQRSAEIARLIYEAVARDARTMTKTHYYQLVLDTALARNAANTVADLQRIADATGANHPVEHSAGVIAEIGDQRQKQQRAELARADDQTELNALLNRRPDEPIEIDTTLVLKPIPGRVDDLIEQAWSRRQEILELALQSENAETALKLARLEYAPDYTIGYFFDHYILPSDAPAPNLTQDHSVWVTFNLPIYFWLKQNEDVKRAGYDLEAAREDLNSIKTRTAAKVTILYRHAQFDYQDAMTYRDIVLPQSLKAFEGALTSYRNRVENFATLTGLRNRLNEMRMTYLQAVNRVLEDRIALEHETGGGRLPR